MGQLLKALYMIVGVSEGEEWDGMRQKIFEEMAKNFPNVLKIISTQIQ